MNQATQMLVRACEMLAEKENRSSEDVMQDLMQSPRTYFPMVFSAENLKQLMPEGMQEVRGSMGSCKATCLSVSSSGKPLVCLLARPHAHAHS